MPEPKKKKSFESQSAGCANLRLVTSSPAANQRAESPASEMPVGGVEHKEEVVQRLISFIRSL